MPPWTDQSMEPHRRWKGNCEQATFARGGRRDGCQCRLFYFSIDGILASTQIGRIITAVALALSLLPLNMTPRSAAMTHSKIAINNQCIHSPILVLWSFVTVELFASSSPPATFGHAGATTGTGATAPTARFSSSFSNEPLCCLCLILYQSFILLANRPRLPFQRFLLLFRLEYVHAQTHPVPFLRAILEVVRIAINLLAHVMHHYFCFCGRSQQQLPVHPRAAAAAVSFSAPPLSVHLQVSHPPRSLD